MAPGDVTTKGTPRLPRCLQLHANDNVAVALEDLAPEAVAILGKRDGASVIVNEPIARGHKVALRRIRDGETVLKYGVAIGFASQPIEAGEWVHTHNCRSGLDERSHTLDRHTGAPTDTKYV